MIKKNKLFSLLIATVIAFLVGSSNVFAFEEGEYFTKKTAVPSTENGYYKENGESKNATIYYQHGYQNSTNTEYDLYCLDGIRKAPKDLKVQSILDNSDPVDATILYMINAEGYSYNAKLTAIRAFIPLTKQYSSFESSLVGDYAAIYGIINSGVYWSSEATLEQFQNIFGKYCVEGNCDTDKGSRGDITPQEAYNHLLGYNLFKPRTDVPNYTFDITKYALDESNADVANGKKLLLEAMAYGATVSSENTSGKEVTIFGEDITDNVPVELKNSDEKERDLPSEYRAISFKVNFKGFASNDVKSSVKLALTKSSDNNYVDITKTVYRVLGSNDEWKEFNSDTDFASIITSDNVTLEVEARIEGKVKTSEIVEIGFIVDPQYMVKGKLEGAYLVPTGPNADKRQRFFVGSGSVGAPKPDNTSKPISFKWNPTASVCETVIPSEDDIDAWRNWMKECCDPTEKDKFSVVNECSKADNDDNNHWCQLKKKYCDVCNTTVNVPSTCTEFSEGNALTDTAQKATITGPEKVKLCVIDYTDSAKTRNTRKLTKDDKVANNPYCNVYCKEDYSMTLPAGKYTISGRYFTLHMAVKGVKTCYTDNIKVDQFKEDLLTKNNEIASAINSGNQLKLNEAAASYNQMIDNYRSCAAGWSDDYDFNPDISFTYQEDYIKLLGDKGLKFTSDSKEKTVVNTYFTDKDINMTYEGGVHSLPQGNVPGYECKLSGSAYKCEAKNIDVPVATFAKKEVTGTGVFAPESVFFTKFSTGVIETNKSDEACIGKNENGYCKYTLIEEELSSKIPDSDKEEVKEKSGIIPVSLKDNKGVYTYNIKFNNVGEFFDKKESGRLIDADETKHSIAGAAFGKFVGNYVCAYVVNCPSCGYACVPDETNGIVCESTDIPSNPGTPTNPPCDGKNCDIKCGDAGCIYDGDNGLLVSVHQSSLVSIGSADRKSGANWDPNKSVKAAAAIEAIQTAGEAIYDEPEYSFEFTPAVITYVRAYNESQSDKGSYLNDTLKCELYSSKIKKLGASDAEIAQAKANDYSVCQSTFLDELDNSTDFKVKTSLQGRNEVKSFLQSDYCKNGNNVCALVGNIGNAWK